MESDKKRGDGVAYNYRTAKKNHKLNQGRIRNERIIMGKKWRKKLENEADEGRPGGMNTNIMGKKKRKNRWSNGQNNRREQNNYK